MININGNEISFDKYIKPLDDRWSKFWPKKDRKLIRHSNDFGYFKLEAKCNWKFAIENYCESYHLPWVHPGLNSYFKDRRSLSYTRFTQSICWTRHCSLQSKT